MVGCFRVGTNPEPHTTLPFVVELPLRDGPLERADHVL
jgi:hypothetical protein